MSNISFIEKRLKSMSIFEKTLRELFVQKTKDVLNNKENTEILSVSTGDASWDWQLLQNFQNIQKIYATDIIDFGISPKDLENLNKNSNWEFHLVNPETKLPFDAQKFDMVFHFDVIEHVNFPYFFLQEQYRVLKEGGVLIIYTPNLFRPANLISLLLGKLVFPKTLGKNNTYGDCIHIQEFYGTSFKNLVSEVGFKEVELQEIFIGLNNFPIQKFPNNTLTKMLCQGLFLVAKK